MPTEPTRRVAEGDPFGLEILNPTGLDKPAFLMNVPFSIAADVPNNAWM